jgi:hypothetical protein
VSGLVASPLAEVDVLAVSCELPAVIVDHININRGLNRHPKSLTVRPVGTTRDRRHSQRDVYESIFVAAGWFGSHFFLVHC